MGSIGNLLIELLLFLLEVVGDSLLLLIVLALALLQLAVHLPDDCLLLLDARDDLAVLVPESDILLLLLVDADDLCLQLALELRFLLLVFGNHLCLLIVELDSLLVDDVLELLVDLLQLGDFLGLHLIDVLKVAHGLLVLLAFVDVVSEAVLVVFDHSVSLLLVLALELLDSLLLLPRSPILLEEDIFLQLLAIERV